MKLIHLDDLMENNENDQKRAKQKPGLLSRSTIGTNRKYLLTFLS